MDIRQLEYFVEVAKTKNFRKASENLHLSQPALSKSIRLLETELNTVLIARTNKSFELTDTGEALFTKAVFLIQQFRDIYKTIEDVRLSNQGEIKIGIPNILGFLSYFELICEFRKRYPGINISVSGEGTKDINAALREDRLDLGLGMLSENVPIAKDLQVIPLTHDQGVLVVNTNKAYSEVDSISIHDVKDENFVLVNEQYLLYDDIMQLCMQSGFTPKVIAKSSQWDFLLKLVDSNFGVSILPRPLIEKNPLPHIKALEIKEGFNWDIGFFCLKNRPRTHAMNQFMEFTVEYLEEHKDFQYVYYADAGAVWSGNWNSKKSRKID
ncbi:MAG: LysR family transcriptional regulator [Clostridia bacterium]|nr:LysR family transcriptional regulator [Lachnospiraceae bacterium]NCB99380.1 LysR family transcriptional regulator [Clostridia bacterium]NCD01517.1 LysR family transcriptional regulator [Clostridia bacterium]